MAKIVEQFYVIRDFNGVLRSFYGVRWHSLGIFIIISSFAHLVFGSVTI